MSDLIDRQTVIKVITNAADKWDCSDDYLQGIRAGIRMGTLFNFGIPSAHPKIVMCADCQKYIDYRCRDEHANLNDWRHEDDYCSFGKRREESNESKERS